MTERKESALMKKNERSRRQQIRTAGAVRGPSGSDSDVRRGEERVERNGKRYFFFRFEIWSPVQMEMVSSVTMKFVSNRFHMD